MREARGKAIDIDKYINTAYDKVVIVADNIELIKKLVLILDDAGFKDVVAHLDDIVVVVNTVTQVVTVSGIADDVVVVANNVSDVVVVSNNVDDIKLVAEHIQAVQRVADSANNVDRLALSADALDIVAASATNIDRLAVSADAIDIVATSVLAVERVSASIDAVESVSSILSSVVRVSDSADNVDIVANDIDAIKAVPTYMTEIRQAVTTTTTNAQTSTTNAASALASKNAATTSEANALTSKNAAASSATAAATSATNAANSTTAALASKNAAATSETNAASSATAAATSETNAASSAEAALAAKDTIIANAATYLKTSDIVQDEGTATHKVMSQGAVKTSLDSIKALVDKATPYSSAIWNQNSDTMTSEGVQNGVTRVHSSMRRCLLLDNGTVNYYLDANNSSLKEDGTASVLTGADGQVMVEIPKCYVKAVYIQAGSSPIIEWSVSAEPKLGYVVHPAFTKDGNLVYSKQLGMWHYENVTKIVDYIYVGAYQASVYDVSAGEYIDGLNLDSNTTRVDVVNDKLASVSGKYPMVGLTRAEFRTLAANRGAGWQQMDFWTHSLLQLLYTTEYRKLNSQAAIGDGNVSVASGYPASSSLQADSPHSVAGKSNAIGNGTGALASTLRDTAWMAYRGIENFWGNCYVWCDGINILDQVSFVNNTATFVDNTSSGYTQLGVASPSVNGYIRKIQADTLSSIPSDVTGGSTVAFSDYYYQVAGWRVLAVGGHATEGGAAGAFVFAGDTVSGLRNRVIGGQFVFKKNL